MTEAAPDLARTRDALIQAAEQLQSTARVLEEVATAYRPVVGEVTATVGGSTQQVDIKMVETLQHARHLTDQAIEALKTTAARVAGYAQSL
ncbi:hypothetical protein C6V83_16720 [Gordonia iterans]|uniref:Uncharacterized protein n=1 Tax=Gordonia iterans TaxID=1004901 RepID=A0A2S0KJ25_9ACTN|nr:hypothetical protein [Gordonia iterans]AVM01656.1 hypothetical protein C6V83_16720 [Gordonia iterans]